MNVYCTRDCKHKSYCKLDEQQTKVCKVVSPEDDIIISGMTFEDIRKKQRKEE